MSSADKVPGSDITGIVRMSSRLALGLEAIDSCSLETSIWW